MRRERESAMASSHPETRVPHSRIMAHTTTEMVSGQVQGGVYYTEYSSNTATSPSSALPQRSYYYIGMARVLAIFQSRG